MYTFLRMDMIDFKNRMKVFDYYMCFNRIRPLRIGRGDLGVHRDFKIHNHFTEQSDC